MHYYSTQGYEIYIPVDGGRVDFIALGKDNKPIKVQVKSLQTRKYKTTQYKVAVMETKRGSKRVPYDPKEVDVIFIIGDNEGWLIPYTFDRPIRTLMLGASSLGYVPRHNYPTDNWKVSL